MITNILLPILLAQAAPFDFDDRVISNPVKTVLKGGRVIEVFEVQTVADTPVSWRPDGTPIAKKDQFPGRCGYKSSPSLRLVWARTKSAGMIEPSALFNSIQGSHAYSMGTAGVEHNGWFYFGMICQLAKGEPQPLKTTLDGFLIGGEWRARKLNSGKLTEHGESKPFADVKSLRWAQGKIDLIDDEAMKKAYGDALGYAQVMAITKKVDGTTIRLVMREAWQPHNCRVAVFDSKGKKLRQEMTPGLVELEGRERGFEVAVQASPGEIGSIMLSERNGVPFTLPNIHLNPRN